MGDICKLDPPQTLAPARVRASATPARRIALKTLPDVRREMGRVIRDVRNGLLESSEGTRIVYMLGQLGRVIDQIDQSQQGGEKKYEDYLREMHDKIIARQKEQKRLVQLAAQTPLVNEDRSDTAVRLSTVR